MAADPFDYDGLMQANLARVFGERDAQRRIVAIGELYAPHAVLYEPHASAEGHAAIDAAVSALLASLPADFSFRALGPGVGHHGTGRLKWSAGPVGGPVAVTGMDIARVEDGRIHTLVVFLDGASG